VASRRLVGRATIRRLPSYLNVIEAAHQEGQEYISGTVIAEALALESIQVRKDIAITGVVGRPRLGFPVVSLIEGIYRFLGWDRNKQGVLVGVGNLGSALLGYGGFAQRGLSLVAAFDVDPKRVGGDVHGVRVHHLDELPAICAERDLDLAVLTVPADAAQEAAEAITDAGIRAIWNFANAQVHVPANVLVQREDLSSGYALLSVRMGAGGLADEGR
jgi:redox-sensing transcriptional repressor